MGSEKGNDNNMVRAVSQDERVEILRQLQVLKKMNVSQLAEITSLDRATVSYHLGILEEAGIVSSKYEIVQPPHSMGKVGRYYTVNPEGLEKALMTLDELVKSLKP